MNTTSDRLIWALGFLEANGGGVQKSYFRDKCFALLGLKYNGVYEFIAFLRGKEWIKEAEQKDGKSWILLSPEGLEQLQILRIAREAK